MNFTFEYNIAGTMTNVVVTIEDAIIAEAQKIGVDITSIESEAKTAIDGFVDKVTSTTFWQRATKAVENVVGAVEHGVETVVEDAEHLVGLGQTPAATATPAPAAAPTPAPATPAA